MQRIDRGQLFTLMTQFLLGSAWLFALGAEAEHRAWAAVLLGMLIGLAVLWTHLRLQWHFPTQSLVQFLPRILGRPLGWLLALGYLLYFFYLAARVTRDIAELVATAFLPETPMVIIVLLLILLTVYAVALGLEPIVRATTILLIGGASLILLGTLLTLPNFDYQNLRPLWGPDVYLVWQAAYPLTITVPFGEAVTFLMVYCSVKGADTRGAFWAVLIAGVFLAALTLAQVAVLGQYITRTSQFPLLDLIRQVRVADVFDRLDPVGVILLTVGGVIKATVFFYSAATGLTQLLGVRRRRLLLLPMAGILAPYSLAIAHDYTEHIDTGLKLVPHMLHLPLQIAVPLLLLIIWEVRLLLSAKGPATQGEKA